MHIAIAKDLTIGFYFGRQVNYCYCKGLGQFPIRKSNLLCFAIGVMEKETKMENMQWALVSDKQIREKREYKLLLCVPIE
jgi:hypothetical protein